MDERYIKRPERVKRAMEQLWSSFVDCTINAPEALALHQYVTSLEKAANRTTPDRNAIIEECAKVMDDRAAEIEANDNLTSMTMGRIYRAEAERIRALKTAPTSDQGGA